MNLNECFVGGNPRVLLLLFCLFCVILICFVGICQNMMRKSKKKLKPLTRKLWTARACPNPSGKKPRKNSSKLGTARACGGTAVPVEARPCHHNPKLLFFSFFPRSNNTTSFILRLFSLNLHNLKPLNLHNSLQTSPNHKIPKLKQL